MRCFLFALALGLSLPLGARAADAPLPQPAEGSRADERFRSMDADNKGHITFEDFQKRYPHMQRPAFDAIDLNRDGAISLEEWRAFFQGHGAMDSMPSGRMPPPGGGPGGGPAVLPGHGGGQGGKPLIMPPSR